MPFDILPFGTDDPEEPGIPVAGLRHSAYPRSQLVEQMPVSIASMPVNDYPHACAFVDAAGQRIGWVPDNLAQVLHPLTQDPRTWFDLRLARVDEVGPGSTCAWVTGQIAYWVSADPS